MCSIKELIKAITAREAISLVAIIIALFVVGYIQINF